jgi:hypothetical protein
MIRSNDENEILQKEKQNETVFTNPQKKIEDQRSRYLDD